MLTELIQMEGLTDSLSILSEVLPDSVEAASILVYSHKIKENLNVLLGRYDPNQVRKSRVPLSGDVLSILSSDKTSGADVPGANKRVPNKQTLEPRGDKKKVRNR